MSKHIKVILSAEERSQLESMIRSGSASARTLTRARILLLSDSSQGQGLKDEKVTAAVMVCRTTVGQIRKRFVQEGLESALSDKPRPGAEPKITGDIEAKLVVLACSRPPKGRARWTLRLLADRLVELSLVESISHVCVYQRLKKMNSSLGL